ncbi:MAG TPA: portal protein [Xanthobacteraceae bacterium]|nr:portal protein [Xanthobacteraceae bacterium]
MADDDDNLAGLTGDDRIVQEARDDFKRWLDWESDCHKWFREDTRFANADARNGHQWPDKIYQDRDNDDRPCLTINKTRTHNRIIINEAMENKSSIKIRPTGGEASYEGSQVMQAIIRRIEYISKATIAYRKAITDQVTGGFGYITLRTDYVNDKSRDQDIYICQVRDPLCVGLDPDAIEPDGSDANFGLIFENHLRKRFFRNPKYRKWKGKIGTTTLGADQTWLSDTHIKTCMYYRRTGKSDTLVVYTEPQSGQQVSVFKSEQERELIEPIIAQIQGGELDGYIREDVMRQSVEWFLIAGDKVIDRGKWAGKYIPIIRLVGEEVIIDGKLDRKGMTRYLIDQQRMLNYNASGQVEFGALQSKSPWVGPARAFEGQEAWKDANRKNYAFLQYNDVDEDNPGTAIQAPQRQQPPQTSPVYAEGMADAERQMMMASGQYQTKMGEEDQQAAASGRAINARQRQGDVATYHFIEHQGDMYRFTGMQLLDLIPKIYDTERTLHVLGEDGTKRWIKIDPDSKQAVTELKKETEEAAELAFNPSIGEYDCMADVGPNYATQRQEAWNAITIILQQNAQLAGIIGDLLFKFGDFPGADEIMERLKREIQATKPYLFSKDADPGMVALQQQVQKLGALNGELMHKLAEMQLTLRGKDEKRGVEAYNAETNRIHKLGVTAKDLGYDVLAPAIRQVLSEMLGHPLTGEDHAIQGAIDLDAHMREAPPPADSAPEGAA